MYDLTSFCEYLSRVLNEVSDSYVILRGFEGLPHDIQTDLDILIEEEEFQHIFDVINKSQFQVLKVNRGFNYVGLFVAVGDDRIVQLDFFFGMNRRWREYYDKTAVFEDRQLYKGFFIVSERHREALRTTRHITSSFSVGGLIQEVLIFGVLNIAFYRYIFFYLKKTVSTENIYVFLGPDGVGKSSLIAQFSEFLVSNRLYTAAQVAHLRPKCLPRLANIFQKNTSKGEVEGHPVDTGKVGLLKYFVLTTYYCVDFLILYFIRLPSIFRNEAILFDRYFYDFLVYHRYPIDEVGGYARFLCKFIPRPKYVIAIEGDASVIAAKKNELSTHETKLQLENINMIKASVKNSYISLWQDYDHTINSQLIKEIRKNGFDCF